jgi:flagellar hook-length control protein FliK
VQLIVQTNTALATDADSAPVTLEAPINAAPPAQAPIDAAPSDAMAPPAEQNVNAPTPAPAHAKTDNTKAESAPHAKASDTNLAPPSNDANSQAPAPAQNATPAPSANAAPTPAPVVQHTDATPPPQIIAQAAPAPRAQTASAEPKTEGAETNEAAPAATSPAPRVTPDAASAPPATSETPTEPAAKNVAKSDAGSTQEKFEAALEKSTPRNDAKADTARANTANTPIIVADASGAAATNIDTNTVIAPPVSALSAATTHAVAQTQALSAEHLARSAPPSAQVAREIVRQFDGETTRFELRLDPPELGRVEVKLEVTRDHKVTAVISADSPQALTELARHARELEQNLQAAGLELSDNGLSFDLRQSREDAQDASGEGQNGARGGGEDEALEQTAPLARPIGLERWRGIRVDVMA